MVVYTALNTTLSNGNLDQFLVFLSYNIPTFPIFILMFVMFSVAGSLYFGSKKFLGEPNILACFVAGSLTASLVGTIMTMTPGIINNYYLISIWVVTMVLVLFYILPKASD